MNGGAKRVIINAWNTASDWDIEGANAQQIASMTEGFVPVIGGVTAGETIRTRVITPVTKNAYTVSLTPPPS